MVPAGRAFLSPMALLAGGIYPFDGSPEQCPGRVSAGFLSTKAFCGHGILYISACAYTGEPLSSHRNQIILQRVVELSRSHGGMVVIQGDWQCSEDQFPADILEQLQCAVVAPQQSTCISGKSIDFFLVSRPLLNSISTCTALMEYEARQHRPILLAFFAEQLAANPLVNRMVNPKSFGRLRPQFPQRDWSLDPSTVEAAHEALSVAEADGDAPRLQLAFEAVADEVEVSLAHTFDCVTEDGEVKQAYLGRGRYGETVSFLIPNIKNNMAVLTLASAV